MTENENEILYHRRVNDERITTMAQDLTDIKIKMNNGLTSKTNETAELVKKLEENINTHIMEATDMNRAVTSLSHTVERLLIVQNSWIRLFYAGLMLTLGALVAFIIWAFVNIHSIDLYIDHVKLEVLEHSPLEEHIKLEKLKPKKP